MAAPAGHAFIQVIDTTGPLVGATCEYYSLADVAQAVYSNAALTTSLGATLNGANASDSKGRFPIHFLDPSLSYKRIIKTSAGATWRTDDPVQTASVASDTVGIVTSIATLQATTFGATPPALIAVISNTSAGDGGGFFRYDSTDTSSADNGATIILDASSNRWKRQTLGELFNLAVTNGWYLPSANTPTLRANSTTVASATSTGGLVLADVSTPTSALAAGFRGSVIVAADANTSITHSHNGKTLYHTSASTHTYTVDDDFPVGAVALIENENGGGNLTIAVESGTLRWEASTGSRTVAANGSASVERMTATLVRFRGGYGVS